MNGMNMSSRYYFKGTFVNIHLLVNAGDIRQLLHFVHHSMEDVCLYVLEVKELLILQVSVAI